MERKLLEIVKCIPYCTLFEIIDDFFGILCFLFEITQYAQNGPPIRGHREDGPTGF